MLPAHIPQLYTSLILSACCALPLLAQDLHSYNMVATASNLPTVLDDSNLVWRTPVGNKHTYGQPVIAGDRILVGMDGKGLSKSERYEKTRAALLCFDKTSGEVVWNLSMGPGGQWWAGHGVCSTPVVDGDRAWLVSPMGELLCIDMRGQVNGNDGAYQDEAKRFGVSTLEAIDGDILWTYDFEKEHGIKAHDAYSSDPLIIGDLVIFATGHAAGVKPTPAWAKDKDIENWKYQPTPNLVVLNKDDGSLVAIDDLVIEEIFHGQWSSPAAVQAGGETIIVWGDGMGYLHGLTLPKSGSNTLQPRWRIDLVALEHRRIDYPRHNDKKEASGPSHTIAKPVVIGNRIYIGTGRDHYYCGRSQDEATKGRIGNPTLFHCLEITGTDAPRTVWTAPIFTTQSTASVTDDGLVFLADGMGFLRCFDAETGAQYWEHDLGDDVTCRSQFVADGKVYVGNDHRHYHVFAANKDKELLWDGETDRLTATVAAEDGLLILAEDSRISAFSPR